MSVQSIERMFSIIEFLSSASSPVPLSIISQRCQLAPTTTHRLLQTLCDLGYAKSDIGGFYSLTAKLGTLVSQSFTNNSLISVAKPHLDELSDLVNETVHLVRQENDDTICVYNEVKAIGSFQVASYIGKRIPMYQTAAGKAILSAMPEAKVRQILWESNTDSTDKNTTTNADLLLSKLEMCRKLGYSIDEEDNEIGITSIGMPLGTFEDDNLYAFSISSLSSRMSPERVQYLINMMEKTKANILHQFILN